ncbi:MAG: hypothetical protein ACIAS6_13625 [Phycisphaerales bacterium JB060]
MTQQQEDPAFCNTPVASLAACAALLSGFRSAFETLSGYIGNEAPLPFGLYNATTSFVADGCRSVETLGRNNHWIYGAAAIRVSYEASIRLLWASRATDGVQRLRVGWYRQRRKWAETANNGAHAAHAEALLEKDANVERQWREAGLSMKNAPDIRQMLSEIDRADESSPAYEKRSAIRDDHYATYYVVLSAISHGIPTALRGMPSRNVCGYVAIAAAEATRAILLAHEHFRPDLSRHWKPQISESFNRIWDSLEQLGLGVEPESPVD